MRWLRTTLVTGVMLGAVCVAHAGPQLLVSLANNTRTDVLLEVYPNANFATPLDGCVAVQSSNASPKPSCEFGVLQDLAINNSGLIYFALTSPDPYATSCQVRVNLQKGEATALSCRYGNSVFKAKVTVTPGEPAIVEVNVQG